MHGERRFKHREQRIFDEIEDMLDDERRSKHEHLGLDEAVEQRDEEDQQSEVDSERQKRR